VAGMTQTAVGGPAFTVRALSATDGSLLWADYYDREGNFMDDSAMAVAVKDNRVFVVGVTQTAVGGRTFTVRTYSATDGSLLWGDDYDREGNLDDGADAVAVKGNRVFVAGMTQTAVGGAAFTVRAYSAKDGSLLWGDDYDREGVLYDVAHAIAVKGNRVFVAGMTQTALGGFAFTVGALSATDGSLLWADYYDREGALYDEAYAVAVKGNRVFAAGVTQTAVGGGAFTVRAYSAK
jgi:TolB-like protein